LPKVQTVAEHRARRARHHVLSTVDPRRVLAQVAADVSAPASARVTAAKALIEDELQREIRKANAAAW